MKFRLQDQTKWHDWFAWRPVCEGLDVFWLETVERRWYSTFFVEYWEYRPKTKQEQNDENQ